MLEGSAFIAAPSGGMTLGQLGADVIRFDQIGGGIDYRRWPITAQGKSLYWHSLNKGKRSIAVDFRKPEGRELLSRLICAPGDDGGLFLTNFPARGWLAYDALKRRREDLIYLNLTGDRHGGSALDYTVNARVGVPFLNGDGVTPLNSALPAWDVIAGQQIALGLLAAERHRSRTGEGQLITLALADVALAKELALRFCNHLERECACQKWPDFTSLNVGDEVCKHRFVPCGAADECQVLEVKVTHVEGDDRPSDGAR